MDIQKMIRDEATRRARDNLKGAVEQLRSDLDRLSAVAEGQRDVFTARLNMDTVYEIVRAQTMLQAVDELGKA